MKNVLPVLCLLFFSLLSFETWAIYVDPSPSYDGSYTVHWQADEGCDDDDGALECWRLWEKVGSNDWAYVSTFGHSQDYTGKSAGTYKYRICYTQPGYSFQSTQYCTEVDEGPVTVTVQAPDEPATLTGPSSDDDGAYTINWSSTSGATSYKLQEKRYSASWSTIYNGGGTSKARSGRNNGVWKYRVRACSSIGCSTYNGITNVIVALDPGVPSSISVTPSTSTDGEHTVSWGSSPGSVSYYELQRKIDTGSYTTVYDSGTALSQDYSSLSEGQYTYRVRGCRTVSTVTNCSDYVTSDTATVSDFDPPASITGPGDDNDGAYTISWSSVTAATYYELQERLDSGTWNTIHSASGTSKPRSGLGNGTWDYRVQACNATECTGYSNIETVIVALTPGDPGTPSVDPTTSSDGSHDVSWSAASGDITEYQLERNIDGGGYSQIYTGLLLSQDYDGLSDGSYTYQVRACKTVSTVTNCSSYATGSAATVAVDTDGDGILDVNDTDDDNDGLPDTWESANSLDPLDADDAHNDPDSDGYTNLVEFLTDTDPNSATNTSPGNIGMTAGEFAVDSTGAANYTIPITVPPGTAGMAPSLSINYSSHGGNDALLGKGWSLGGLSVITRCPATTAQDSSIDPVDFDSDDKFCLDGQRLIAINGTYGANGTEYRTEIDRFSKIVSNGTAGTGPAWFKVWTKSGRILEYGNTANSRIEAQGESSARVWAVNKITDTVGNYLTVTYTENGTNGEYRPDTIDYTGNSGESLSPYASVEFEYENRSGNDIEETYLSGSLIKNTKRLSNIKTYVGTTLVRDYQIGYDNNGVNGVSRVTDITECSSSNGTSSDVCLPSTTFDWAGSGSQPSSMDASVHDRTWQGEYIPITGDWNGDGQTDLFLQHKADNDSYMYTVNSNGVTSLTGFEPTDWGNYDSSTDTSRFIRTGDWNGDGLTDMAVILAVPTGTPDEYDVDIEFYISNGTSMVSTGQSLPGYIGELPYSSIALGDGYNIGYDWNGDGRSDLMLDGNIYTADADGEMQNTFNDFSSYTVIESFGDWNGDGRTDLIIRAGPSPTERADVYLSTGTDFVLANQDTSTDWGDYQHITGDYNGDGLTDLFVVPRFSSLDDPSRLYLSKGDGTLVDSGYNPNGWFDYHIITGDWNGDGKTDLARQHKTNNNDTDFYYSTGTGMASAGFSPNWDADEFAITGDWTGDGLTDLWLFYENMGGEETHQYKTTHSGFDVVDSITNGLGVETQIAYTPLTDNSVYSVVSSSSYPTMILEVPMQVVETVTVDDGVGGMRSTTYEYEDFKVDVSGRGLLGFKKISAIDSGTGIETVTTYKQDFPYIGRVSEVERILSSNTIGKVTRSFSNTTTHTGVKFPFPSQVIEEKREIDGTLVSTTTTDNTFDGYGNPDTVKVEVIDASDTSQKFYTFTDNTHTNDTNDWHIGLLTRTEVTQYLPGNTDNKDGTCTDPDTCATRVSGFSYNGDALLSQEVIEPDITALKLTTDYTYDGFGNPEDVTVNGVDITSRTTTTSYDASGQFATGVTNALGHSESRTWDDRFGVRLTLTGPNNLTTDWGYDTFGRRITEDRADGSFSDVFRNWCPSGSLCPAGAVMKEVTVSSGGKPEVVFLDELGREIETVTLGLNGRIVHTRTDYDALGRVDQRSRPYFAGETVEWHTFTYDVRGRVLTETKPDSSVTTMTYDGLETDETNDKSQVTTRVHNARGELIQVVDDELNETDYAYDPFGNLVEVVDALLNTTTNTYNIRGFKTAMSDPDMGSWTYDHNVLGEVVSQTDAKSQTGTMDYDLLGRMVERVDDDGGANEATSTWVYDFDAGAGDTYTDGQADHSIGKPIDVTGGEGESRTLTYNADGRLQDETTTIDSTAYTVSRTYDQDGRLATLTYPASTHYGNGLTVDYDYDAYGHLQALCENGTACTSGSGLFWRAEAHTAAGQLAEATYGNGVVHQQAYDADTGRIDTIQTYTPSAGPGVYDVQDLDYAFDTLGNLTQRKDLDQGLTEDFLYDDLNRLTQTDFDDGSTTTSEYYTYDAIGNLKSKTGIGDYSYTGGSSGPHAVIGVDVDDDQVDDHSFTYDDNGNMTSGYNFTASSGRTLTWTPYNKPRTISQGATTLTFSYGSDRARFKQVNNVTGITTYYIGGVFEVEEGTDTTYVHYIGTQSTKMALYKSHSGGGGEETLFLHRDHLGSVTAITDENAIVVEALSYDPWGKRRNSDWTESGTQLYSSYTPRGYTGHEMLDDVGIIHMNGRVQDPDLGRFLSADPFVQDPANPQNLNRYSYVLNSPLSYTDPSGHFIGMIAAAITYATVAATEYAAYAWIASAAVGSAVETAEYYIRQDIQQDKVRRFIRKRQRSSRILANVARSGGSGPGQLMKLAQMVSGNNSIGKPIVRSSGSDAFYREFDVYEYERTIRGGANDTNLGLEYVNGSLSGEIVFGCNMGEISDCKTILDDFNKFVSEDPFLDITNTLVDIKAGVHEIALLPVYSSNINYGGRWDSLGKISRITINMNLYTPRDSVHEYGHALGLGHRPLNELNFMSYNPLEVPLTLSPEQRLWLQETYKQKWWQFWR